MNFLKDEMDGKDLKTVDLLLTLNCPYINKSQSSSDILQWIQNIDKNTEERSLLLKWILENLGENAANPSQALLSLGIFNKSQQCQLFVDGALKKEQEARFAWQALFDLLEANSKDTVTKDDCLVQKKRAEDFLDALLENFNPRDQLEKPIPLLDYALEKEIGKKKSSGSIPRHVIQNIHSKVNEEKENLNTKLLDMTQREPCSDYVTSELKGNSSDNWKQSGNNSVNVKQSGEKSVVVEPYTMDELQAALKDCINECELMKTSCLQVDGKYEQELKPVLGKAALSSGCDPVYSEEIAKLYQISSSLNQFLNNCHTISDQMITLNALDVENIKHSDTF
eukprot:TRINITY_DN1929_c0_g1_i21.p1 TRINITY_DN1929_c0_g1~~TRINITY_DN1929_c0_g1_i21.p1  ORF type:complete len:338 (-),score=73.08 TRINITY_DN1929_c0_g1_i21:178-1191(-)